MSQIPSSIVYKNIINNKFLLNPIDKLPFNREGVIHYYKIAFSNELKEIDPVIINTPDYIHNAFTEGYIFISSISNVALDKIPPTIGLIKINNIKYCVL
jgi:hypothetical protein